MSESYDLYCDFDLQKHIQTYTNYLEVIILADGTVEYAIPSHQEKLISTLQMKWQCTRTDALNRCPKEMYLDFEDWLLENTGCIAVWSCGYRGNPNDEQKIILRQFINANVMKNTILGG